MANIARVEATNQWQNLEDIIEGFTPEVGSRYELQNIGNEDLQIYEGATAPETERDGFVVPRNLSAKLTKEDGGYWFIRAKYNSTTANLGTL